MKIFWSWQSDTPGNVGRFLVRDALREAIDALKEMVEVAEPMRESLHLDHDREGVPGSPELVRTILDKVDLADIVVADVTLVGHVLPAGQTGVPGGKKLINSNVAIELGYALRALSDRKVLMVFNAHFGIHEELPFDLRHRGGAIVFKLSPDASQKEIAAEKKQLVGRLVSAIRLCLLDFAAEADPFEEMPSTQNRGMYFQVGETLAQIGEPDIDQVDFAYDTGTLCYLRLIPTTRPRSPIPLARLVGAAAHVPLLSRSLGGALQGYNAYGAIAYEPGPPVPRGPGKLKASTQLFQNGELWSIGESLIVRERGSRPARLPLPFLAAVVLEQTYYDVLRALIGFASEHLDLEPPWHVECGLVGIQGLTVCVPPDEMRGPVRKSEVIVRRTLKVGGPDSIDRLLLAFFEEVHDSTGYLRPDRLCGFPPNRPHWPPQS